MTSPHRHFHRLAWVAVLLALTIVVFGAFVRLSNAGLSCPDWPTCYGRATWPVHEHEIAAANAVFERAVETRKAWREQVHRHLAASLGVLILVLALLAARRRPQGMASIGVGAALVASGIHDVVIGSGVEHMGHNSFGAGEAVMREHGSPFTQRFRDRHDVRGQGIGAELIADRWAISRQELDELALRSHQKAARATEAGWFHRELVELHADGAPVRRDQGIRADTSIEALAGLKPAFKPDGRITAGNSSQISDGAAAVLLMARDRAESLGLRPRARIVSHTSVGCDPVTMLEGPIPATRRILAQTGTALRDIDVVEINEAFASVVAAWQRELDPDMDRVNPRGGAIALGHPLGSTGARLVTTLLHELEDEDGELGLVTMCCGGGLGTATLIQRV
jgi:acetyl-CoA acetyltransferase family protein